MRPEIYVSALFYYLRSVDSIARCKCDENLFQFSAHFFFCVNRSSFSNVKTFLCAERHEQACRYQYWSIEKKVDMSSDGIEG